MGCSYCPDLKRCKEVSERNAERNQKKWEDWEDMKEMTTALKQIDKEYKDSGATGKWMPDWAPKTP